MSRRGQIIAISTAALACVVAVVGLSGKHKADEEWYVRKLETGDAAERQAAWEWIQKHAPFKVWKYTQADLQQQFPYHDFGPLESNVQMSGGDIRASIRKNVAEQGSDALPHFLSSLESESWFFRCLAVIGLGELGPEANAAISKLERLVLSDPDPQVQNEAEIALQRIQAP